MENAVNGVYVWRRQENKGKLPGRTQLLAGIKVAEILMSYKILEHPYERGIEVMAQKKKPPEGVRTIRTLVNMLNEVQRSSTRSVANRISPSQLFKPSSNSPKKTQNSHKTNTPSHIRFTLAAVFRNSTQRFTNVKNKFPFSSQEDSSSRLINRVKTRLLMKQIVQDFGVRLRQRSGNSLLEKNHFLLLQSVIDKNKSIQTIILNTSSNHKKFCEKAMYLWKQDGGRFQSDGLTKREASVAFGQWQKQLSRVTDHEGGARVRFHIKNHEHCANERQKK
ncbi:hypothetical protein C0J52_10142 [Blattella germanica]|nr:hypothetical protein C0J52_10142 [Blattella germanica]